MKTIPDTHRDLLEIPAASLSTIGADGYPQVTMVWFFHDPDDDTIKLSLNTARKKTQNLQARQECALLILDPEGPYRYLEIRAKAHIAPDEDYAFADRLGAKYGGVDLRSRDLPGERRVVVSLEPVFVGAVKMG